MESVSCEIRDRVATLTLQRPARLNAFDLDMATCFTEMLSVLVDDPEVRVVVIRGAGRVFSAGGDVVQMNRDVTTGDRAAYFREPLRAFNGMALALRACPKPVVAVLHGAAAGVAFNLMLACDLRLAVRGTRFAQAFIRIGLSPDGGGTWHLPALVGYARACELTMMPTELDADKAAEWGLINWVVEAAQLEAKLSEVCGALANGPGAAIARTKALLQRADDGLAEHMEAERLAQVANADSDDFAEGLSAFVEKRRPQFT